MKKLALVVLTLLVAFDASLAAQGRLRGLGARKKPPVVDLAPVITIDTPTTASTHQTSASSVDLQGPCTDDRGCTLVTVSNAAGGGPYTASIIGNRWSVVSSAAATIAQHGFTVATDTLLTSVAPSTGMGWVERVDTGVDSTLTDYASNNAAGPTAAEVDTSLIYTLTPSATLAGTNYYFSATNATVGTVTSAQNMALVFRYTASDTYCFVLTRTGGNTLQLLSRNAGVGSVIATASPAPTVGPGSTVKVDVSGSTIKVYVDDVEKISATSAFCGGTVGEVGVGFGALAVATEDVSPNRRWDDFTLVDRGAAQSGVTLSSGANVITVTATDVSGNTSVAHITVTKGVSDTVGPAAVITGPTAGDTWTVTTAALPVSGTASDNVGVASVNWTCPQCGVTSGSATFTDPAFSFTLTLGCSAGGTANVITVTPADAAMNTPTTDVLTVTCDSTDVTNPVVAITSDGGSGAGADYSTSSASVPISGTASDAGGSGLSSVTWVNSTGSSGTASGTTAWSVPSVALAVGANLITVTARDGNNNASTPDTVTITRTAPTLTVSTTSLPGGLVGTAYNVCLVAAGGTGPYTWTLQSGTLPSWATIALDTTLCGTTNRYKITGTPDAAATTSSLVFHVVDNVAASANSNSLSITIASSGTGADAYWTTMQARGDVWVGKSVDLRSSAAIQSVCKSASCSPHITYDFTNDTDPHKQNAAKSILPFWSDQSATVTIAAAITDTTATFSNCTGYTPPAGAMCIVVSNAVNAGGISVGTWAKIDNEFFIRVAGGVPASKFLTFSRAAAGTAAATHASGAFFQLSTNSMQRQVEKSLTSDDGYTYFYSWDSYFTDSNLGGNYNHKGHQFPCVKRNSTSGNDLCWQVSYTYLPTSQTVTLCGTVGAPVSGSFNAATDVASVTVRSVSRQIGGSATWTDTDGALMGPGVTSAGVICPQLATFFIKANTRTRFFVRVEQRANDYDYVTLWIADETRDAVKILDAIPYSVDYNPQTVTHGLFSWWIEFNSSTPDPQPNRLSGPNQYGNYVTYNWWMTAHRQAGLVGATTLTDAGLASSGALARPQ